MKSLEEKVVSHINTFNDEYFTTQKKFLDQFERNENDQIIVVEEYIQVTETGDELTKDIRYYTFQEACWSIGMEHNYPEEDLNGLKIFRRIKSLINIVIKNNPTAKSAFAQVKYFITSNVRSIPNDNHQDELNFIIKKGLEYLDKQFNYLVVQDDLALQKHKNKTVDFNLTQKEIGILIEMLNKKVLRDEESYKLLKSLAEQYFRFMKGDNNSQDFNPFHKKITSDIGPRDYDIGSKELLKKLK